MQRYFFHLFNDIDVPDLEGRDLAGDAEARSVAILECREMLAETVKAGRIDLNHRIDVEDGYRRLVCTTYFGDVVTIKAMASHGSADVAE